MTPKFQFEPHLKYPHMRFAMQWGIHHVDFPAHKHDFSELFVVTKGTGNHTVGDYHYPLVKGDVFVIHGDTEHSFTEVDGLELVNMMFDHASPIFDSPELRLIPGYQALFNIDPIVRKKSDYQAKLNLNTEQTEEVFALMSKIEEEYENAPTGYETMLKSLLRQLVVSLARFYQGSDDVETNNTSLVLSRALVYIEQYFTNSSLKSDDIAKSAFISVRQLERLFKSYLQQTPNQYLRQTRLKYAEKLLTQEPQRTVQSISDQAGFSDSNYFAKCFRDMYSLSPRKYKEQYLSG